jgi:beta-phosphoglucomutase-like phosphatase (HAD superfamily)
MKGVLKEYQAYLFDMDGTLVNSEPLKGKALALAV